MISSFVWNLKYLKLCFQRVDGSNNRSEKKPTLVEIAKRIAANQRYTSEEQQLDQPSSMDVDGASSWQPTAIAFVEGRTGMNEMESASNEREMYHARQDHNEKVSLKFNLVMVF